MISFKHDNRNQQYTFELPTILHNIKIFEVLIHVVRYDSSIIVAYIYIYIYIYNEQQDTRNVMFNFIPLVFHFS